MPIDKKTKVILVFWIICPHVDFRVLAGDRWRKSGAPSLPLPGGCWSEGEHLQAEGSAIVRWQAQLEIRSVWSSVQWPIQPVALCKPLWCGLGGTGTKHYASGLVFGWYLVNPSQTQIPSQKINTDSIPILSIDKFLLPSGTLPMPWPGEGWRKCAVHCDALEAKVFFISSDFDQCCICSQVEMIVTRHHAGIHVAWGTVLTVASGDGSENCESPQHWKNINRVNLDMAAGTLLLTSLLPSVRVRPH